MRRLVALSLLLACAWLVSACGPAALDPPRLPEPSELAAEHPSVETILWWLPQDSRTVVVARGPFGIPAIEARPPATLESVFQAVGLTLLRNLQGGRFQDAWGAEARRVQVAVDSLRLDASSPQGFAELSVLVLEAPLSEADWGALVNASSESETIEGAQTVRVEQIVRREPWSIWVAWPTPSVLLLSNSQSALTEALHRRRDPEAPRALAPTHPGWRFFSPSDLLWALHAPTQLDAPICGVKASDAPAPGMIYTCLGLEEDARRDMISGWKTWTQDGVRVVDDRAGVLELHADLGDAPQTNLVILTMLRSLGYVIEM